MKAETGLDSLCGGRRGRRERRAETQAGLSNKLVEQVAVEDHGLSKVFGARLATPVP